jgi:UTP--glucose-1-phosphate uridylyltransferase
MGTVLCHHHPSGKSEGIQWEKIKPPTDEVVVPYNKLTAFSDGE